MKKSFSESTSKLIESIHLHGINYPNREIYLFGEEDAAIDDAYKRRMGDEPGVEFLMANRIIKNLRLLDSINTEPILIHMKTCGGEWGEGMAIYDAIKNCCSYITILNYTHARSMSSIILQAADNRVMMPNSYFMYHHGSYGVYGDWQKVQSIIDWDRKLEPTMLQIYADRMIISKHSKYYKEDPKKVQKTIDNQMNKKIDVFFTAKETVQLGLADKIFDGNWAKLNSN